MKQLQLGKIRIDTVVELDVEFDPSWLLETYSKAEAMQSPIWFDPRLINAEDGLLKLTIQSYVIRTGQHTIIVDTCNGNHRERVTVPPFHRLNTSFLDKLKAIVDPEEVDFVVCSHLHGDHVGWNVRQTDTGWVPTFPNAKYLFHKGEVDRFAEIHSRNAGSTHGRASFFECIVPIIDSGRAILVEDNHVILQTDDVLIETIPLPGHTMHQMGVRFSSGGKTAVFLADAIHHALQFAHTDWRSSVDDDKALARATVEALIDEYCDKDVILLPAHSPDPTACRLVTRDSGVMLDFITG